MVTSISPLIHPYLFYINLVSELVGNGRFYSLNYDRMLTTSQWFRTSARAGLFAHWWGAHALGFLLEFNGLLGKNKHPWKQEWGCCTVMAWKASFIVSPSKLRKKVLSATRLWI